MKVRFNANSSIRSDRGISLTSLAPSGRPGKSMCRPVPGFKSKAHYVIGHDVIGHLDIATETSNFDLS